MGNLTREKAIELERKVVKLIESNRALQADLTRRLEDLGDAQEKARVVLFVDISGHVDRVQDAALALNAAMLGRHSAFVSMGLWARMKWALFGTMPAGAL